MRRISVGLVVCAEDDVAAGHEALIAYLESHIFGDGLIGSIVTTAGITERVEARLEEMRRRFRRRRRGYRDTVWLAHPPPSKKKKRKGHFAKRVFGKLAFRNDPLHCDRGIRTQGGMRCASTALSRAIYRCLEERAPDRAYFIAARPSQCDVMPRRQHSQTWRHL